MMETMENSSETRKNYETLRQDDGIMDTNDNRNIITTNNQDNNKTALIVKDEQQLSSVSPCRSPVRANEVQVQIKPCVENEQNVEWELVPPDGGWGWLVLMGSMLVNVLVPGTVKSFGVLFVEFLEVFDAKPTAAAWIPALCYFLYSSLGPLSSILSVKFSYRTVTLLGGTFAAAGMIITFWAQSVSFLYISYGLLVGTGAGLSFPPTVYIVTSYFVRLRGLANGLCISGSAIGSIILPPVLRYLLETYGYRGAVLVMGGVTLNVWVAAMFYHPVEQHMKRVPKKEVEDNKESSTEKKIFELESPISEVKNEELVPLTAKSQENDYIVTKNDVDKMPYIKSPSSPVNQNLNKVIISPSRQRKISAPINKESLKKHVVTNSQIRSTPALHGSTKTSRNRSLDMYSQFRLTNSKQREINTKVPIRSPSTSSFQYVSTPYHGSTLSALHPQEFASSITLRSLSLNPISSCCKNNEKKVTTDNRNKYFDVTLLKDPLYLVILISNCTNAISYTNFIILLPSYAIMLDYDKSLAAWLISTVSALDLVGRIGGSALSDTEFIPKYWYFIGGLFVSGIALTILPLAKTYVVLSVFCGIFGLASGVYVGVTAVIMADMLGTERLTSSYGISLFVNGILQLVGPPLCGLWFEKTGTYVSLFMSLGIVLIMGAAIWGFVPFIKKKNIDNNEKSIS